VTARPTASFDPTTSTRLFVPGHDGVIAVWELDDPAQPVRRVLASTTPSSNPNFPVLALPARDGSRLLVGDYDQDSGVPALILDVSTGAEVARFDGTPGAISHDGALVALSGPRLANGTIAARV